MGCQTVKYTAQNNLCCGCGICKGVCPKGCIAWIQKEGLYLPHIDESRCVSCGLCAAVCPGLSHGYEERETAEETVTGAVLTTYNAWSKDQELRHVSASGGVVSTMIQELLNSGMYDGAFCLDTYDYRSQLKTRLYTAEEVAANYHQSNAPKSRYLPVSHENAVAYMRENRSARLILVGTSCAIRGIQSVIQKLSLNRAQYLFIGLFCDKVLNYNVLTYWQDRYCNGNTLTALHFKNKESGGWPGDMKFFAEGREPFYVPLADRARAKAYFMPERCLYCVDKLNVCADISLGDNYTGKDESKLGSNSVIIRTQAGANAWSAVKEKLEVRIIGVEDIQKAQAIDWRLDNLYFGDLKTAPMNTPIDLNSGVPREKEKEAFAHARKTSLQKLNAGAVYDTDPTVLIKQIQKDNKKPNPAVRFAKRVVGYIRRRMK